MTSSEAEPPRQLSDEDLARLRTEFDAAFGAGATDLMLGTLSGPLPPEVIDALGGAIEEMRAAGGPADAMPPPIDDLLDAHDQLRRVAGDLRVPVARPPDEGR